MIHKIFGNNVTQRKEGTAQPFIESWSDALCIQQIDDENLLSCSSTVVDDEQDTIYADFSISSEGRLQERLRLPARLHLPHRPGEARSVCAA